MKLNTILIVDDDDIVRETLQELLSAHFRIVTAENAEAAEKAILEYKPSLVLLDMHMPKVSGIEICKKIRAIKDVGTTPIIMISGADNEETRTKAFLSGVDDFVAKPVSSQELVARILSKLSWHRKLASENALEKVKIGNLCIDERRLIVTLDNNKIKLTHFEYTLLKYFIDHVDHVLSRSKILEDVWQTNNVTNRTIDTHIHSLRHKLENFNYEFGTVHGAGYILRPKVSAQPSEMPRGHQFENS